MDGLKTLLEGWAGSLFFGIVALVAIVHLFKREFVKFAEFAILAVLVAVFVFSPSVVVSIAKSVGTALGAGH